ncbi:MAG: hypothetical protein AB1512_13510 [Thermodesulfobacteriota bacterium]
MIENAIQRWTLSLAKLFMPERFPEVSPFKNLLEAYRAFGGDETIQGLFDRRRALDSLQASVTSSSFSFALQNAMNMYLSKIYWTYPFREEILISERKEARDFRTIHSVQLSYFSDIGVMYPEVEDYPETPDLADSEAQYAIDTRGTILWVTRMVIINNRTDLIKAYLDRVVKATRRTHARYVWNFFLNNATTPDGTGWFTADHGNLGSQAIGITAVAAAITALANLTEPGSGEPLGMDLASFKWHLVVGTSNWQEAVKVNQNDSYFTGNDLTTKVANPCRHLFGEKNERIITCPFITDNDWGVIRNAEEVPIVEMSYLNGRQEPEILISDGPREGQMLKRDRIGYKIRHEYGGGLPEHRGGYKSLV